MLALKVSERRVENQKTIHFLTLKGFPFFFLFFFLLMYPFTSCLSSFPTTSLYFSLLLPSSPPLLSPCSFSVPSTLLSPPSVSNLVLHTGAHYMGTCVFFLSSFSCSTCVSSSSLLCLLLLLYPPATFRLPPIPLHLSPYAP